MSNSILTTPDGSPSVSGVRIPILFGAVLALLGASVYMFYLFYEVHVELKQVRGELAQTRKVLLAEVAKVHKTSTVSTRTSTSVESLKMDVDTAHRQARQLAGEARVEASKHADELAAKLEKIQEEQGRKVTEVSAEVSQVKDDANATKTKVGEVSTEVGSVKSDLVATKSELEKTISELKSTRGDLGVQSGLIATNARELSALKALGERDYTEFSLAKEKTPRKVGDVQVRLKTADPQKNRYTIEVIAYDKPVEKKDKTVNEPVQFLLPRAPLPYELVVNEVKKDMISGYIAAPKVQQARGQGQ